MTGSREPQKRLSAPEQSNRENVFPIIHPSAKLVEFDERGNSEILSFGADGELHIGTSSHVLIKTWSRYAIQVQLSNVAPFDLHYHARRVWLNEKGPSGSNTAPNFVTIHVPYLFGVLGLSLTNKAFVESDAMPCLANILVKDKAQTIVQSANLFLQTSGQTETNATLVPHKEDVFAWTGKQAGCRIVEVKHGTAFILAEGGVIDVLGQYKDADIILKNGSRMQHNAASTGLNTLTLGDNAFWKHPLSNEYAPPQLELKYDVPFDESRKHTYIKDQLRFMMSKLGL